MALRTIRKKTEETKMSVKDRLAAKRAAKSAPVEEEPVKRGRGRPKKTEAVTAPVAKAKKAGERRGGKVKGMRNVVSDNHKETLETLYSNCEDQFESFKDNLNKFVEEGNKSAAMKARKSIMDFLRTMKDLRKEIQNAKAEMVQQPAA